MRIFLFVVLLGMAKAQASSCPSLPNHLRNKNVSFVVKEADTSYEVQVALPKLVQLPCRVGGDWGPDYQFDLPVTKPIQIVYRDVDTQRRLREFSVSGPVEFSSTPSADIRSAFPHFLKLNDTQSGKVYRIYFSRTNGAGKVEVTNASGVSTTSDTVSTNLERI